jgi:hypothetical protein
MPFVTAYQKVGKLFLSEVFSSFQKMRNRLRGLEFTEDDEIILRKFDSNFHTNQKPKQFYNPFYRTKLMKVERYDGKFFVKIFGFLRTLFVGVLKGDPRLGYLSRRVTKYKETLNIVNIFEDFLLLYRKKIGFFPHSVRHDILASANLFSECEKKPEELCHRPECKYIPSTLKRSGYCRTNTTRRRSRKN